MHIRKPTDSQLDKEDHTVHGLQVTRERGYGDLKDYNGGSPVRIAWNLNESADRDGIFAITLGERTAYVNLEEVQRLLRWV